MELWEQDVDVFAQGRTHIRGMRLALSQVACLGRHTVTGLLSVAGRQEEDWSADYRFFSQARWDCQGLFDSVMQGAAEFLPPGAPVVCAMDDTLLRKTGTRIRGAAISRDPQSPRYRPNFIRGQRFLQVSAMLPASPEGSCPARAIPVRFQPAWPLPKPGARADEEERREYRKLQQSYNLSTMGRDAIAATRDQLDRQDGGQVRILILGVDGSYTNKAVLRNLPPRTVLIGRIRKDAELFHVPQDCQQPAVGRKRSYGQPVPTPEALLKDDSIPWEEVRAFAAGKMHTFRVKTIRTVLWPKAGPNLPLRLIVIAPVSYRLRKGSKLLYRQPAYLICTDPNMPVSEVVQYYIWRWGIEVDHRDEKQLMGVGEAQVHSPASARRQPVFAVACYAKLLLAGARVYGSDARQADLPLPKWRQGCPEARVTTGDLIRRIRQDLWGQALRQAERSYSHFVVAAAPSTNCPKLDMSLSAAIDHTATG